MTRKKKSPLSALTLDDSVIRREIRQALALRKKQLEGLKKKEEEAGVSTEGTYDVLKLHGVDGIPRFFGDETTGTMFQAKYPLKELVEPGEDPIILQNEEDAKDTIMGLIYGVMVGGEREAFTVDDLAEMRWIDVDGRLFITSIGISLEASMAPMEETKPELVPETQEEVQEDDGEKVVDMKIRLARNTIDQTAILTVLERNKLLLFMDSLDGPDQMTFASDWLNGDIPLADKPGPPALWEPPRSYEDHFQSLLDMRGIRTSKKVREMFLEKEIPVEFIPVGTGANGSLRVGDVETAVTNQVNAVGSVEDTPPTRLVATYVGTGKKLHLMTHEQDVNPKSWEAGHTLCGLELSPTTTNAGEWSLDNVCANCRKVYDVAPDRFTLT